MTDAAPSLLLAVRASEFASPGQRPSPRRFFPGLARLQYRYMTGTAFPDEDAAKRWDAANVLRLAEGIGRHAPILDCGAYNSTSLFALARSGYRNLHGIDLNPGIIFQPYHRRVRYSVQDMQATAFDDESFDMIVCASAIEHGVSWPRFLAEARRLLRDGGRLYVSTDLVGGGEDTSAVAAFGLPWTPLTVADLRPAAAGFAAHGFAAIPVPDVALPATLPLEFRGVRLGFVAFATHAVDRASRSPARAGDR